MALPNSNISTTLVGNTLGSSSRDVGTLCTHTNINKWSKWKPVRFNKVVGLTESDLKSVRYGLGIPSEINATPSTLSQVWTYLKPRGGSQNEYYRLGDFRNYEHSSGVPFSVTIPDTFLENASNPTLGICTIADSGNNINSVDLFENLYFGAMVMVKDSPGERYYKTALSPYPIENTINLKDSPLSIAGSTLTVYLFMSPTTIPEWTSTPYIVAESLNAEGFMSFKDVIITGVQMQNKNWLNVTGINMRQWTEPVWIMNSLYATATLITQLSSYRIASSVTVTAERNSDSGQVYNQTHTIGGSVTAEPSYIDQYDYNAGDTIGFTVDAPAPTGLPALPWNDYYNITYTINYTT